MRKQIWKKNLKLINFLAATYNVSIKIIPNSEWTDPDGDELISIEMRSYPDAFLEEYDSLRKKMSDYNYFSVGFGYPGPRVNSCEDDHIQTQQASEVLEESATMVQNILKTKFQYKHDYWYPDGSLFYIIKTDLSINDFKRTLEILFENQPVFPTIVLQKSEEEQYKAIHHSTLKHSFQIMNPKN